MGPPDPAQFWPSGSSDPLRDYKQPPVSPELALGVNTTCVVAPERKCAVRLSEHHKPIRRRLSLCRNSPRPEEWMFRSAVTGLTVFINLITLGACARAGAPSVDADGVRYFVLGMLALTGVILICLALGLRIPIPKVPGGYLGPITARSGRIYAGFIGLALVAVCVVAIVIPPPIRQPEAATTLPVRELTLTVTDAEEVDQLRVRAENGDASAQYRLGVRYAAGRGVTRDGGMAVKWLERAAEQGYGPALYYLGILYLPAAEQGYIPLDGIEAFLPGN